MRAPLAVVDLGTQSCLLLVGRVDSNGRLEILEDLCEIPKMGAGLDQSGLISEAGIARVEDVLVRFRKRALELGCTGVRVGGTAALRRAGNQAEVVARLKRTGCAVEVIGEADEARLGWLAAANGEPRTCVVDVGGGSTEVVARAGEFLRSAPIGASVLAERVGSGDWDALLGEARRVIGAAVGTVDMGSAVWVALGGTASNLGCLDMGLGAFDHVAVEGHVCAVESTREWGARLAALTVEQRCELPIEAARAQVMPAGLACMTAMLELFGAREFRISGLGLRYGYLSGFLGLG